MATVEFINIGVIELFRIAKKEGGLSFIVLFIPLRTFYWKYLYAHNKQFK
jgi:hypothetical protein